MIGENEMRDDPHVTWFMRRLAAKPPGMSLEALLHELVERVRAQQAAAAPDMARVLLELEWTPHDESTDYCRMCGASKPDYGDAPGTHAVGCALDAALKKAGIR